MKDLTINVDTVKAKFKMLKTGKACGPENIASRVLIEIISKPVADIFTSSVITGIVPEDWRVANVVTIFKKGKKNDPANYGPISLTSQIGKVLESIIAYAISNHIVGWDLIRKSQHGFTKSRSCLTNLLSFLPNVTEYVDTRTPVDVIYLDFKKAFDVVPHQD